MSWIAFAIILLVFGFLLLLVRAVKAGALLLLAGLVIVAVITANITAAQQARATQAAAVAATTASAGQTAATVAIILLIFVVLALLIVAGYLYIRLRRAEARQGRWAPGPNALWRREGESFPAPAADPWQALQGLITLEVLRYLRELRQPPAGAIREEESLPVLWEGNEKEWWHW
jgi:hypothetical protein